MIGSVSYAGLISLGVTPVDTMLIMLSIPILEGIAFWLILRRPAQLPPAETDVPQIEGQSTDTLSTTVSGQKSTEDVENNKNLSNEDTPLIGLKAKIMYIPSLFKYMIPLTLVYLLEYFINQGLVSLYPSQHKHIDVPLSVH